MTAGELEALLFRQIPLSRALNVKLTLANADEVRLNLPLQENINHKATVFGGSLYAACTLASYSLFLKNLYETKLLTEDIVISEGQISYLNPSSSDVVVIARWTSEKARAQFVETLTKKSKARCEIKAFVMQDQTMTCEFTGKFVAKL